MLDAQWNERIANGEPFMTLRDDQQPKTHWRWITDNKPVTN